MRSPPPTAVGLPTRCPPRSPMHRVCAKRTAFASEARTTAPSSVLPGWTACGPAAGLRRRRSWNPGGVQTDSETPTGPDEDEDEDAGAATTPAEVERDAERDQAEGDATEPGDPGAAAEA